MRNDRPSQRPDGDVSIRTARACFILLEILYCSNIVARVGGAVQRRDEGRNSGDEESHLQGGGGRVRIGEGQGATGSVHRPPDGAGEDVHAVIA